METDQSPVSIFYYFCDDFLPPAYNPIEAKIKIHMVSHLSINFFIYENSY